MNKKAYMKKSMMGFNHVWINHWRRLDELERKGHKRSKLTRDKDRDVGEKVALGTSSPLNSHYNHMIIYIYKYFTSATNECDMI